jgi:epoxyqueuosine reductase QueG
MRDVPALSRCVSDECFVGPRELDATKCISYLTIELKGASTRRCDPRW